MSSIEVSGGPRGAPKTWPGSCTRARTPSPVGTLPRTRWPSRSSPSCFDEPPAVYLWETGPCGGRVRVRGPWGIADVDDREGRVGQSRARRARTGAGSRAGGAQGPPRGLGGRVRLHAEARRALHHRFRSRGQAAVHRARSGRRGRGRARNARLVPLHARPVRNHVSHATLDEAPVRGLRDRGGDQRALPVPARPRTDGPLGRVRLSDPHGVRLRSSALARRSGCLWRRDLVVGRYGGAVRRNPVGSGLGVDDDQRPGDHPLLLLRSGRREAGRADPRAPWNRPERHLEGIPGPARLGLPPGSCATLHCRHVRVVHRAHTEVQPDLDLRLSHPRGRSHGRRGTRLHASERVRVRRARDRSWPRR